jgi:hypothetical protein
MSDGTGTSPGAGASARTSAEGSWAALAVPFAGIGSVEAMGAPGAAVVPVVVRGPS